MDIADRSNGGGMKAFLLTAITAVATLEPAAARAGSPYVAIEGGILFGRNNDIDEHIDFTSAQGPATPAAPTDVEFDDVLAVDYGRGADADIVGGYDFGLLRLELELGYKRSDLHHVAPDENLDSFLASFNSSLNRPSAVPDPGAPGLPALTADDLDLDGRIRVLSAMTNALVDIGLGDRLSIYGGGGYGRSWAKALGDTDSAWGWQWIAGVRYQIGPRIALGAKFRYFNSGILKLRRDGLAMAGNPDRLTITSPEGGATIVARTTDALLMPEIEGRFRSRSLLGSLIFKF